MKNDIDSKSVSKVTYSQINLNNHVYICTQIWVKESDYR